MLFFFLTVLKLKDYMIPWVKTDWTALLVCTDDIFSLHRGDNHLGDTACVRSLSLALPLPSLSYELHLNSLFCHRLQRSLPVSAAYT